MRFETYTVEATNLPEHANNAIHTDAGARAAGFPAALVAGVTTYGYLTEPVLAAWGAEWLATGGGEVRFHSPVFAGDVVHCVPQPVDPDEVTVTACVGDDDTPRATLRATHTSPSPSSSSAMRAGESLRPVTLELRDQYGPTWRDCVHPSVWPSLANHVVHRQVARGAWIHLRSIVRHLAVAPAGALATVTATVVARSAGHRGERAILDVDISVDGCSVARLEHEAIVALAGTTDQPSNG